MDNRCWFCMTDTMQGGKCRVCGRQPPEPDGRNAFVLPPGTALCRGRFMVGAKLGKGGFGITYTGLDRKTNTPIAIKEFFPRHLVTGRHGTVLAYVPEKKEDFDRSVHSFRKEADIINHLKRHPGIVNVKYRFDDNNTSYIGMELLQGSDLRRYVNARPKPLSAREAFLLLLPVMDAVQFIHENNVQHRDISPDNIFLCRNEGEEEVPKLIDFGAAHIAVSEFTQSYPNVRKSGYSPPEQNWDTSSQGPWTDVYSFAATFYYAITRKVPTAAMERSGKVDKLPVPSEVGADISKAAEVVLLKGMAVRVTDRYPSMRAFRAAMREALWPTGAETGKKQGESQSVWEAPSQIGRPSLVSSEAKPQCKRDSRWVRVAMYAGDLLVFCGIAGRLFGSPGFLLGLPLMALVNTVLEFTVPHASLCMRLTSWRVQSADADGLTLRRCATRNLLMAIPPFAVFAWLWMLLRGDDQMLNDTLTNTRLFAPPGAEHVAGRSKTAPAVKPAGRTAVQSARPEAQSVRLVCVEGAMRGREWQCGRNLRIGRGQENNDIAISPEDGLVSKSHCVILRRNDGYYLGDIGSRNGTYLNGERLDAGNGPKRLVSGDRIRAGREIFEVRYQ